MVGLDHHALDGEAGEGCKGHRQQRRLPAALQRGPQPEDQRRHDQHDIEAAADPTAVQELADIDVVRLLGMQNTAELQRAEPERFGEHIADRLLLATETALRPLVVGLRDRGALIEQFADAVALEGCGNKPKPENGQHGDHRQQFEAQQVGARRQHRDGAVDQQSDGEVAPGAAREAQQQRPADDAHAQDRQDGPAQTVRQRLVQQEDDRRDEERGIDVRVLERTGGAVEDREQLLGAGEYVEIAADARYGGHESAGRRCPEDAQPVRFRRFRHEGCEHERAERQIERDDDVRRRRGRIVGDDTGHEAEDHDQQPENEIDEVCFRDRDQADAGEQHGQADHHRIEGRRLEGDEEA